MAHVGCTVTLPTGVLGDAVIESCKLSCTSTEEQLPVPVLVKYNITEPFEISKALGV